MAYGYMPWNPSVSPGGLGLYSTGCFELAGVDAPLRTEAITD
jgi:hypothetical protein